jgi:hypothetical protein
MSKKFLKKENPQGLATIVNNTIIVPSTAQTFTRETSVERYKNTKRDYILSEEELEFSGSILQEILDSNLAVCMPMRRVEGLYIDFLAIGSIRDAVRYANKVPYSSIITQNTEKREIITGRPPVNDSRIYEKLGAKIMRYEFTYKNGALPSHQYPAVRVFITIPELLSPALTNPDALHSWLLGH